MASPEVDLDATVEQEKDRVLRERQELQRLLKDKYRGMQSDRRGIGHATANEILNLEFAVLGIMQMLNTPQPTPTSVAAVPSGIEERVDEITDELGSKFDQIISRLRKVEIRLGKLIKGRNVSQLENVTEEDLKE